VGATGSIMNLNFSEAYPLVDFMEIGSGLSAYQFDLKDIRVNTGADIGGCTSPDFALPGVSCTPAGSPFTLTNGLIDPKTGQVDTVSITMTVDLYGYTGGSSGTNYNAANAYVGIFTTQQVINANIATILGAILSGGAVNASWSAALSPASAVPEPASIFLLGAGLIALGSMTKRLRRS
jgi:hypothetical protein